MDIQLILFIAVFIFHILVISAYVHFSIFWYKSYKVFFLKFLGFILGSLAFSVYAYTLFYAWNATFCSKPFVPGNVDNIIFLVGTISMFLLFINRVSPSFREKLSKAI